MFAIFTPSFNAQLKKLDNHFEINS